MNVTSIDFPKRLRQRLGQSLPGNTAQRKMAPEFAFGRHRGPIGYGVHRAAVCLCLFRHADCWWIPLTVRHAQLSEHAGQVSLPGGRIDGNEGAWQAARREFHEELGCDLGESSLLGSLSPLYVYGSHHHVEPFVASLPERPALNPSESEVAEIVFSPVEELLFAANRVIATMQRGTARYEVPGYRVGKHTVWGATAMILAEFIEILNQPEPET